MYRYFLFWAVALPLAAQDSFYACMSVAKEYVVGAKLPPSGLFVERADEPWKHVGFGLPFATGLDYDGGDHSTIYLSAGNGLIRASEGGTKWKLLTGSDVTELRDVAVDRKRPGTIYFAHSAGIRVTHDSGATWQELSKTLHRKFTESVKVDRERAGVVVVGGEEGIFRSQDGGETWKLAGAAGWQISRIQQSPHDACYWMATTSGGGLFASNDCGVTFESASGYGINHNLYDVAFDPQDAKRMATGGWATGVAVSEDGGRTWQPRNAGLPNYDVSSVAFDPLHKGRLYASVNEDGLYVSEDAGKSWKFSALPGSVVYRMMFVPAGEKK